MFLAISLKSKEIISTSSALTSSAGAELRVQVGAQSLSMSESNISTTEAPTKFRRRESIHDPQIQNQSVIHKVLDGCRLGDSIQSLLFISIESTDKCYDSYSKEAIGPT